MAQPERPQDHAVLIDGLLGPGAYWSDSTELAQRMMDMKVKDLAVLYPLQVMDLAYTLAAQLEQECKDARCSLHKQ